MHNAKKILLFLVYKVDHYGLERLVNLLHVHLRHWQNQGMDFPGGSVVQNSPANAGDMGSIPGPGRFHTLRDNEAHVPQLLSPPA